MKNHATNPVGYSARTARARTAVHRFALPGMGFGPAHGQLGIFRKSYKNSQGVKSLERFSPAQKTRNFFENVRARRAPPEFHTGQGFPAHGSANGRRGSVRGQLLHGTPTPGYLLPSLAVAGSRRHSPIATIPVASPAAKLRVSRPSWRPRFRQTVARHLVETTHSANWKNSDQRTGSSRDHLSGPPARKAATHSTAQFWR